MNCGARGTLWLVEGGREPSTVLSVSEQVLRCLGQLMPGELAPSLPPTPPAALCLGPLWDSASKVPGQGDEDGPLMLPP